MPLLGPVGALSVGAVRRAMTTQPAVARLGGLSVPIEPPAVAAALLPARLLIHAADGGNAIRGVLACVLLRVRTLVSGSVQRRPPVPVGVQIDDLQGRQFFASDDARSLLNVPLPAGTYHVTARRGDSQRRYAVTLEQGATFDLHLRQASDRT